MMEASKEKRDLRKTGDEPIVPARMQTSTQISALLRARREHLLGDAAAFSFSRGDSSVLLALLIERVDISLARVFHSWLRAISLRT